MFLKRLFNPRSPVKNYSNSVGGSVKKCTAPSGFFFRNTPQLHCRSKKKNKQKKKHIHTQNDTTFNSLFESHLDVQYHMQIYTSHRVSSQSLNLEGRRGTTDDVTTIPFHPSLSSAALRESPNPIPVHSLMLSSHLFFCLPLLLAPFTVPWTNIYIQIYKIHQAIL